MNIMLTVVAVVSFIIGQVETGILISVLVVINVVMGARQEIKALTSVEALQSMQVPSARVRRDGSLVELPAADLVPGDVVLVEAGDLIPADGRIGRTTRGCGERVDRRERSGGQECRRRHRS
jgi:Ca2+-transporting ATPase